VASAVSVFGSRITIVVLPIIVFRITGSPLLTSLLAAVQVLPYLVFGLVAGAAADRLDRRRIMVASDIANALLIGSVPVAAAFGSLRPTHVFAVALLSATAFVWFEAASFGAVPAIAGHEGIVSANSILGSTGVLAAIVGPSIGGLLAATVGQRTRWRSMRSRMCSPRPPSPWCGGPSTSAPPSPRRHEETCCSARGVRSGRGWLSSGSTGWSGR
jgi:MFS family permease